MNKITLLVGLMLLVQGLAWAEAPATQPAAKPPIVTGTLAKPTAKPEDTAKIAAVLGHNGVLFVRSQARWDELNKLVPDLTPDTPMPKFDFAKQSVVLVYRSSGRPAATLSLTKHTVEIADHGFPSPDQQLDFFLGWDNSVEKKLEYRSAKFILAIIPATPTVHVTLSSVPLSTDDLSIVTEFSATLGGKDGGDIVDGLQATITPKATTIKPSEDILIDFELHLAQMPDAHPQQFGPAPDKVHVWDAEGSNGYYNYGFFVTTPDGKTAVVRPKETEWYRNILGAIGVTAKEPYIRRNGKFPLSPSMRDLGINTSAPGSYTITGLYEEAAATPTTPEGKKTSFWGGSIASNTITVEVKK